MFRSPRRRQIASHAPDDRKPARRAIVEAMEPRQLLAAAPVTPTLGPDGTLDVVGTKRANVITAGPNPATPGEIAVTAGGALLQSFPAASVSAIRVDAGAGNDQVTIAAGLAVPV